MNGLLNMTKEDVLDLCVEFSPDSAAQIIAVIERLTGMTEEERLGVFRHFCTSCGSDDSGCQCWNDE